MAEVWCKSRTKTTGPWTSGPRTPQSLKAEPQDPLQNLILHCLTYFVLNKYI